VALANIAMRKFCTLKTAVQVGRGKNALDVENRKTVESRPVEGLEKGEKAAQ
jgi:hypothetical protein